MIAARDIVIFDRDDADKPTCKALILDPNSNFAFQGGLGKRTLTVNGALEIHGSLKMHAPAATDDMAIQLCAAAAAERVIKLERGGKLLNLYREGWRYYDMGYAATLAWLLFVIVLVLTVILFRTRSRWVYEGAAR